MENTSGSNTEKEGASLSERFLKETGNYGQIFFGKSQISDNGDADKTLQQEVEMAQPGILGKHSIFPAIEQNSTRMW